MLLAGVELNQEKIESQNIANNLDINFSVLDSKKIEQQKSLDKQNLFKEREVDNLQELIYGKEKSSTDQAEQS